MHPAVADGFDAAKEGPGTLPGREVVSRKPAAAAHHSDAAKASFEAVTVWDGDRTRGVRSMFPR